MRYLLLFFSTQKLNLNLTIIHVGFDSVWFNWRFGWVLFCFEILMPLIPDSVDGWWDCGYRIIRCPFILSIHPRLMHCHCHHSSLPTSKERKGWSKFLFCCSFELNWIEECLHVVNWMKWNEMKRIVILCIEWITVLDWLVYWNTQFATRTRQPNYSTAFQLMGNANIVVHFVQNRMK